LRGVTLVIAHRGASAAAPENTLAAFELAVALGADGIELDVRRSLDGHAVIHHDAHLPDGRLIAATLRSDLPDTVPDLAEALDACAGAFVNIEIKNHRAEPDHDPDGALVAIVADEINRRDDPTSRWLVSSFDLATIDDMRRAAPGVRTAYLTSRKAEAGLRATVLGGHDAWHPEYCDVDAGFIRRAHAMGIAVNVWTCDEPGIQQVLMAAGVDGICTNVPDVALTVRARQG
jgi:glycerophosphoryl diester phosphodiesterase